MADELVNLSFAGTELTVSELIDDNITLENGIVEIQKVVEIQVNSNVELLKEAEEHLKRIQSRKDGDESVKTNEDMSNAYNDVISKNNEKISVIKKQI